jgi:hypothetical protein
MEDKNAALLAQECTATRPFSRQRNEFNQVVGGLAERATGRDEWLWRC